MFLMIYKNLDKTNFVYILVKLKSRLLAYYVVQMIIYTFAYKL